VFFIPGYVIALCTFPGVIVHEAAHLFFCKLRKVAVFDVCFFRLENPSGYVIHENPKDFFSTFLICIGPLIINTLLCVFFCLPAFVPVRVFDRGDVLCYFLLWLGVSIGMHAFPSTQDAIVLSTQAGDAAKRWNPLAILSIPLAGVFVAANIMSFFWLDMIYGLAVGLGIPELLFNHVIA
jgi:hypothetical protein